MKQENIALRGRRPESERTRVFPHPLNNVASRKKKWDGKRKRAVISIPRKTAPCLAFCLSRPSSVNRMLSPGINIPDTWPNTQKGPLWLLSSIYSNLLQTFSINYSKLRLIWFNFLHFIFYWFKPFLFSYNYF